MLSELLKDLKNVVAPYSMPSHVANRISVLVANESVVYVDGKVTPGEGRSTSGTAVVFTSCLVVVATWRDHYLYEDVSRNEATADVRIWARSCLLGISIGTEESRNIDRDWSELRDDGWPYSGQLSLRYGEPGGELMLPLMQMHDNQMQQKKFRDLITGLHKDLG